MKYELIIFDIDETLLDFKKTEREALKNTMIEYGIDYREEYHLAIYKEINSSVWKELEEGKIKQQELNYERFNRFLLELNLDFDTYEFSKRYAYYASEGAFLFEGALDLIKKLSKEYKLAVITNGITYIQEKRLKKSGLKEYFNKIVISEKLGISKPNEKIFKYTLDYLNIEDNSKAIIIGDSLSSDIKGGLNAGIDTCWYNPKEVENRLGIIPTFEIKGYDEIKDILS